MTPGHVETMIVLISRPFQITNFSQEKSPILEISHLLLLKVLHYMKNWSHDKVEASLRQIFWARAYVEDTDKGVYFSPDLVGTYSFFSIILFSKWRLQMPTTGVAQWTCAVSDLGFIYIYGPTGKKKDRSTSFWRWVSSRIPETVNPWV